MQNLRRLCITPQDVFEGHGMLVSSDAVPAPSVSITPPQSIILDSTMPPTSLPPRMWDRMDALRQLKEAFSIDAPPRLVVPTIPMFTQAKSEDLGIPDERSEFLCGFLGKIQPSMRASRTLREIHSECAALMNSLSIIQHDGMDSTRSDSYAWLINNEGVDILQARAHRALRKAHEWGEVRELLDQEPFPRRFFDSNNAEGVIGNVIKFRACVADAKKLTNEFATLLDRIHLIAPAIEDALGRSRTLDELEGTTSLEFSAELDNLLKAMGSFEGILKQNNTALLRNVDAITERVAHLRQRLAGSN